MHNAITPLLAAAMIAAGSAMRKAAEPQLKPTSVLVHGAWPRNLVAESLR
jgi:hypothetical protein